MCYDGNMDFSDFIFALSRDWITLMSGIFSVLFAILGYIKHKRLQQLFTKPENQRKVFWGMALLCFFFASVRVWTDEHRQVVSLENQVKIEKERKIPKLSAQVDILAVAPAGHKWESSIVTVVAIIRNTGAPSIADDFKVTIKVGEKEHKGIIVPPPIKEINLWTTDGKNKEGVALLAEDYLPRKCLAQPIVTGGGVFGFIQLLVTNVQHQEIHNKGIITISFRDVLNNVYSFQSVKEKDSESQKPILNVNKLQERGY